MNKKKHTFIILTILFATSAKSSHKSPTINYNVKKLSTIHQRWINKNEAHTSDFHSTHSPCPNQHCAQNGPDVIMIGTGHAGSTSLYSSLVQHPQIMPSQEKELRHFGGINAKWHDTKTYNNKFHPKTNTNYQLSIEASTHYFSDPMVPAQVRMLYPTTKIIILLRDPATHCFSAHREEITKRASNLSCNTLANLDISPARQNTQYNPCIQPTHYTTSLERWLAHFPAEQLLVLFTEEMYINMRLMLQQIEHFLNLSRFHWPDVAATSAMHVAPTRSKTKTMKTIEQCMATPCTHFAQALTLFFSIPTNKTTQLWPSCRHTTPPTQYKPQKWVAMVLNHYSAKSNHRLETGTIQPPELFALTIANRIAYCAVQKCAVIVYMNDFTAKDNVLENTQIALPHTNADSIPIGTQNKEHWPKKHFTKIVALADTMRTIDPSLVPWLWYTDADGLILDFTVPIQNFIPQDPSKFTVAVNNPMGPCAGSYMVENSNRGFTALSEMYHFQQHNSPHSDQAALYDYILTRIIPKSQQYPPYPGTCRNDPAYKTTWQMQTICYRKALQKLGYAIDDDIQTREIDLINPTHPNIQAFPIDAYVDRSQTEWDKSYQGHVKSSEAVFLGFKHGDLFMHQARNPFALGAKDYKKWIRTGPQFSWTSRNRHTQAYTVADVRKIK